MSIPEPFDREMVNLYLSESGTKFLRDQKGNFCVIFASTEDRPEIQVFLSVEADDSVYVVRVFSPEGLPTEDEAMLLDVINRWNREHRWPKAVVGQKLDGDVLRIWTEMHLPVSCGVHQEMIDLFTSLAIRTSHTFFVWLADQRRLPTVEQLEAMFKAAG